MLTRWLIAILLTVSALVVIDRASLVIAPCSEYSGARNNHNGSDNKECTARKGLIIAGIEWLADVKPESWTALATVAIAAFTLTLWLSSEKMWRVTRISTAAARRSLGIARRQIELARQEFLSTHRPKIRIKSVSLMNQEVHYDEPIIIRVNCVNHGATDATLVTYGISVIVVRRGVALPPDWQIPNIPVNSPVPNGITLRLADFTHYITESEEIGIRNREADLYCLGYLHYWEMAPGNWLEFRAAQSPDN
jgi:hypothetical protein